jgi:transposase
MDTCLYASDLTDAEWALLAPLVPRSHPAGRRQTYPLRRIVDAIFYLLRTGAQWRLLPHEYPPRGAVFYHYAEWRENGTWEHVTQVLRESYRRTIGRAPQPTAAIIDSQSVKTSEMGGPHGYDGGKRSRAASGGGCRSHNTGGLAASGGGWAPSGAVCRVWRTITSSGAKRSVKICRPHRTASQRKRRARIRNWTGRPAGGRSATRRR